MAMQAPHGGVGLSSAGLVTHRTQGEGVTGPVVGHHLTSYRRSRSRTLLLAQMGGMGKERGSKQGPQHAGAPSAIAPWPGGMAPSSGSATIVENVGLELAAHHLSKLPGAGGGHSKSKISWTTHICRSHHRHPASGRVSAGYV